MLVADWCGCRSFAIPLRLDSARGAIRLVPKPHGKPVAKALKAQWLLCAQPPWGGYSCRGHKCCGTVLARSVSGSGALCVWRSLGVTGLGRFPTRLALSCRCLPGAAAAGVSGGLLVPRIGGGGVRACGLEDGAGARTGPWAANGSRAMW